jgi:hypothetical protein
LLSDSMKGYHQPEEVTKGDSFQHFITVNLLLLEAERGKRNPKLDRLYGVYAVNFQWGEREKKSSKKNRALISLKKFV